MTYRVKMTRPGDSGVYKATWALLRPRTEPIRLSATTSCASTSPTRRNQPSSLGLGKRGEYALLSCFWWTDRKGCGQLKLSSQWRKPLWHGKMEKWNKLHHKAPAFGYQGFFSMTFPPHTHTHTHKNPNHATHSKQHTQARECTHTHTHTLPLSLFFYDFPTIHKHTHEKTYNSLQTTHTHTHKTHTYTHTKHTHTHTHKHTLPLFLSLSVFLTLLLFSLCRVTFSTYSWSACTCTQSLSGRRPPVNTATIATTIKKYSMTD